MQEIIESIEHHGLPDSQKKIIVMDAGISTKENLQYLREHHYDYITVAKSSGVRYETIGSPIKEVKDNKRQSIRLERDKVNERIGRLKERCSKVWSDYDIPFTYDNKENVSSIIWKKKADKQADADTKHGKYLLQTSLDENDEKNIWEFYNVIRTVEETFRILKSDLDIRPVYHKRDAGTKAHLHLAILAYWVVSTSRYQLKKAGIHHQWSEVVRILSTHKIVSTRMQQTNEDWIEVRQCTQPEPVVTEIYMALNIKEMPCKRRKFVWHPERPPENMPVEYQVVSSGRGAMWVKQSRNIAIVPYPRIRLVQCSK
jgi:transposase